MSPARGPQARASLLASLRPWPVMVGIPSNHARIAELSAELVALEQVKDRHELWGDAVARREVYARLAATRADLEDQLQAAVSLAKWHDGSEQVVEPGAKLSPVASELADDLFRPAPPVWSELVNRDSVSSNSVKARRDLLHAMINAEGQEGWASRVSQLSAASTRPCCAASISTAKEARQSWRFCHPPTHCAEGFVAAVGSDARALLGRQRPRRRR